MNEAICPKCGLPVAKNNDVNEFVKCGDLVATGYQGALSDMKPRHLLPVYSTDGTRLCEGSPSRAQYLGFPRDSRPEYPYNPSSEAAYQEALIAMYRTHGEPDPLSEEVRAWLYPAA